MNLRQLLTLFLTGVLLVSSIAVSQAQTTDTEGQRFTLYLPLVTGSESTLLEQSDAENTEVIEAGEEEILTDEVVLAAATSETVLPASYSTESGSTDGQPVNRLHVQDQSGLQNDPGKYLKFLTPNVIYSGYRTYYLPAHLTPTALTALKVRANYQGAARKTQSWIWSLYNWSTRKWVSIGDNKSATAGRWTTVTFKSKGALANYVNPATREIWVQVRSNNATGDLNLDYEALLISANVTPPALPISGVEVPALRAFDTAMVNFMTERNIQAGTLAVSRNGVPLLERGYGWQDRAHQRIIAPNTLMRVASVDKPLTAAAIKRLIAQGQLSANTKIFAFLNITPPPGRTPDPRLQDITIQHLLEHRGGWDRDQSFDPMFKVVDIAHELGIPSPASIPDVARYMAGQPLQFTPGTRSVYSNFGYALLRLTITKVTNQSLVRYFQSEFRLDVERSYAFPQDRNAREIWYADPYSCPNVYQPTTTVPCPDGGFAVEAYTLVASSATLANFLNRYWINGDPRAIGQTGYTYLFYGDLPGTFTFIYQHPNGTNVAVLLNQRKDASNLSYHTIQDVMTRVIDALP